MGLLLCLFSFGFALGLSRRSLGAGLGATLTAGYFYGILRARFLDGFSHFIFDAALLGLYVGYFALGRSRAPQTWSSGIARWAWALGLWPLFILLLSPFLEGQPLLVQFVGLRASVMFLPLLVIGARMKNEDLEVLSRWVMWLNVVAFGFVALELAFGVPAFFPENAVTQIIYHSNDVGPEGEYRIPACFSSAHAYAGSMVISLPLLMYRWQLKGTRKLPLVLAMGLSVLGIFVSGARTPVVQLGLVLLIVLMTTRLSIRTVATLAAGALILVYVVATTPRFQRFLTLKDTDYVEARLSGSFNHGLLEVLTNYPMGGGLASAAGTSIPFFLMDQAKPQIGLENEYSRLALEQGLIGLLLWGAFIVSIVLRWPRRGAPGNLFGRRVMWALTCICWATAFMGTGMLTSIPATLMMVLQMGVLTSGRWAQPAAVYPLPQPLMVRPREAHP